MPIRRLPRGKQVTRQHVPQILDIPAQVHAGLNHLVRFNDSQMAHLPYTAVEFASNPPKLTHGGLDWLEANSYCVLGLSGARHVPGRQQGLEAECNLRRHFLRAFDNLDGFAYRPNSPFNKREYHLWEQRQTLYVLVAWYLESPDP